MLFGLGIDSHQFAPEAIAGVMTRAAG